jgi:hypothetical protein
MTDKAYTRLLQQTARAYNRYAKQFSLAIEEYERRYGEKPGDHDNDFWIDTLEGGCGFADESITAEQIHESAERCLGR